MIAAVVIVLVSIIPAIAVAEVVVRRRKLSKWKQGRAPLDDDKFVESLGNVSVSQHAAIRVRKAVADATRIPTNLIAGADKIQDMEMVGHLVHSSVLDYFTDLLAVDDPKDESALVTVRDFVVEFGPQLK